MVPSPPWLCVIQQQRTFHVILTMLVSIVKVGNSRMFKLFTISEYHIPYLLSFFVWTLTVIDTVPDNCTHGAVKLVGGNSQYEGNVEVCINGIWATICDIGWNTNDARVACGNAGYPGPG